MFFLRQHLPSLWIVIYEVLSVSWMKNINLSVVGVSLENTMLTNNHWQMSALPLTRPTQGVNRIYDLLASFWWDNGDDYFVYCLSWFLGFIFFIFWDSDDDLISCCCSSLASKYPRGILYHVVVFLCLKISQSPLDFIIFISKLEKYFKNIPIPLWFCHICFQVGKISQKYPNAFLILSYFVSK